VNQLSVLESNIIEKNFGKTQIKELQVIIDGYKYISEFNITKMFEPDVSIILGSTWLETLGTFILDAGKKFLTFFYKKTKVMLQAISMTLNSEVPSSEDFKNILKMIN
jgi:hypothetical protein